MIRFFCFLALFPVILVAQVTVHINSGDPVYPFPQFQPYVNSNGVLENLGSHNAVGVTHAEMEQAIRDAYQIQMNRATKQSGSVGGKSYIKYASTPQCSEGDGYGLLGAAAMADKETFDGLWLYIHDFTLNKVKRYSDCKDASPGYAYSQLPGWIGSGSNSAADGDFDIALALLTACKQWGDKMGIKDACGNDISYRQAAIDFLTALTDTMTYAASGSGLLSGDIGLDGYIKGGDSWGEMTAWAGNKATTGFTKPAQDPGPKTQHFDYAAPAYFTQFADFLSLEDSVKYAWNIYQFRRAAASSDWIMGKLLDNTSYIPFAGDVTLSATNQPTFVAYSDGEDFRLAWRTILNYMWHGNPSSTWDPAAHQVIEGTSNSFERDIGTRYAKFLWDTRQSPWNNSCEKVSNSTFEYWGPSVIKYRYSLTGEPTATFVLNWVPGTGSPSAVAAQDFDLMAELYRTCETTWDAETPGDGYLTSVPHYFHGWFRLLGMLVLTGNYQSPSTFKPAANCKVYCGIDKTFAFERDTVTYTLDYRNYGSVDASGVTIIDTLHQDFDFVSATNGGLYNNTSHTVFWNIGTLPGFKTATGVDPTVGQVQFKVMIRSANEKQYRNRAVISCTNGTGWISNEYPNNRTAVMQRNYLDIARRALILNYKASKDLVKPGESVEFTIDFQNSSEAGWINGGRSGVRFSFSMGDKATVSDAKEMRFRLFHDAQEAYIDYGNYRVSYFMYDSIRTCYQGATGCTNGWDITPFFYEGLERTDVKVLHENIVPGEDKRGKWNQRIILQFSDPLDPKRKEHLSTLDYLLRQYYGNSGSNIHKGGSSPLRLSWSLHTNYSPPQANWAQNWSWDAASVDDAGGMYWPVTNDWTDPDKPDVPIDRWHPKSCSKASHTVDNILVEEWDGYTWRRVAGNGPMPGREVNNVVIRDTIPDGFTFEAFTGENPLGVAPSITGGKVVSWTIPKMQIKQGGIIKFTAKANGTCPGFADLVAVNRAWISADRESAFADSSEIAVSCDTVIKPPPPDHIDIVLDTLLLDMNKDADFVRINMDEGTVGAVVYAVVRDKNGKFIRKVEGGLWTSRDNTVVTAVPASATSWQGIITKVGGGPVVVVVTDPADPTLKPDSLAITAVETPPWPAISKAVMGDANGDVVPDMVTLTLNDTFHVNQQFDSIAVDYRGTRYVFPKSAVNLQERTVVFTIAGLTVADPQPTGTVTMYITVDGSGKQVTKELSDGVNPAISAVTLTQDITGAGYDTLNLAFTEEVAMSTLIGATLQLIRTATGDTVLLPVVDFRGPELYGETRATVFNASGIRPFEGDWIRLVPGDAGGTLTDKKKNLPHPLNRAVQIPERPAQLADSWYVDENADGIIDAVWLKFFKPVDINGIVVSIVWDVNRFDGLEGSDLSSGTDKSLVRVLLPPEPMAQGGAKTGGSMFTQVRFTAYVDEERSMQVRDSAAPVISAAFYKVGTALSSDQPAVDSFVVDFSENVSVADVPVPFLQMSKGGIAYTFSLQLLGIAGNRASFIVIAPVAQYPETGDLVSINPVSAVRDSSTWQNNPENRRVAFTVVRGAMRWDVIAVPNPFDPEISINDSGATAIRIVNPVNTAIPLTFEKAHISIYDAVGNAVIVKEKFAQTPSGPVYYWDGANRHHRMVGNGTYIGVVSVDDAESRGVKRVRIGIRRGGKGGTE